MGAMVMSTSQMRKLRPRAPRDFPMAMELDGDRVWTGTWLFEGRSI